MFGLSETHPYPFHISPVNDCCIWQLNIQFILPKVKGRFQKHTEGVGVKGKCIFVGSKIVLDQKNLRTHNLYGPKCLWTKNMIPIILSYFIRQLSNLGSCCLGCFPIVWSKCTKSQLFILIISIAIKCIVCLCKRLIFKLLQTTPCGYSKLVSQEAWHTAKGFSSIRASCLEKTSKK